MITSTGTGSSYGVAEHFFLEGGEPGFLSLLGYLQTTNLQSYTDVRAQSSKWASIIYGSVLLYY
jgi:hypothetical protein